MSLTLEDTLKCLEVIGLVQKKKKKGKKTIYPGNESTMDKCGKTLTIDYLGKENRVLFCFDCCHFFCRFAIISKFRS